MREIPRRKPKVRVNAPCPCGSGKKYKKCHGSSSSELPSFTPGRLDAHLKKLAPPRKCLVPSSMVSECSRGTINAHTVSRSGSLGAIARDGHVYSYKFSVESLDRAGGRMLPSLVGWRDASTFPGFCGVHDKRLFAPLEDEPFVGSMQQCFLLAYRIVAREFYAKLNSSNHSAFRDVQATGDAMLTDFIGAFNLGVDLGLRDSECHKQRYDAVLESGNWRAVRAVVFKLNGIFPIQCAGGFFPELDVNGKVIQTLGISKKTPDVITVSSIAAEGRSYVSFCWLADSDVSCSAYMSALMALPPGYLPSVLEEILLQTSENCHISPDWYDGLSVAGKEWVCAQTHVGIPSIFSLTKAQPPAANWDIPYFSGLSVESIDKLT